MCISFLEEFESFIAFLSQFSLSEETINCFEVASSFNYVDFG